MKTFIVIGFTLGALAIAACSGGTDAPAASADSRATPPAGALVLSAKDFSFVPAAIELHVGKPVTLFIRNDGSDDHDLKSKLPVSGLAYDHSDNTDDEKTSNAKESQLDVDFAQGHTAQVSFTPTTAGTFPYGCSHTGHADKGMVGTFVVTP